MLYWFFKWLSGYISAADVFTYLTMQSLMAALTALIILLLFGGRMVNWLKVMQIGQVVRHDGPQSHFSKADTPTMGGVLVLLAISIAMLLWADITQFYTWLLLAMLATFGLIGFLDDYLKVVRKNSKGLVAKYKYGLQSLATIVFLCVMFQILKSQSQLTLNIPFTKQWVLPLGIISFFIIGYLTVVGSSNAVNLTDGLDGLAILPVALVAGGLGIYAYVLTHVGIAHYLKFDFITGFGVEQTVVFCAAIFGAGFGFLWFNSYPAEIFMGDVGSLPLGAILGVIAVGLRQELILLIMGLVFVAETVSVILQVGSYKLRKKRIFKMAPLHHHFELKGWPEPKVIVRFWIIAILCVLVGLLALKVR